MASMMKKITHSGDISVTKRYFWYKIFSVFIIYQGLSFGGI